MSNKEYKDCIVKMLDKIEDSKMLKRLYDLVHYMFLK